MAGSEKRTLRDHLARMGLVAQASLVAGVLCVAWLALVPAAFALSGTTGLLAATVGLAVCLLGAELALALSALAQSPSAAMVSLALGMFARTVVPMVLGVALHLAFPQLAGAGMIFYLLVFYLVALATESTLLVAKIPPSTTTSRKAI